MVKHPPVFFAALILALSFALPAIAQERREIPGFRTYGEPASLEEGAAIDAFLVEFKDAWARQDPYGTRSALHAPIISAKSLK